MSPAMVLGKVQVIELPKSGFAVDVVLHAVVVTLLMPYCAGLAYWWRLGVVVDQQHAAGACQPSL